MLTLCCHASISGPTPIHMYTFPSSYTLCKLEQSLLLPRWYVNQIYVSCADPSAVEKAGLKVNKKGGCTISTVKLGGWKKSFLVAKEVGAWEVPRQSKKPSAKSKQS